MFRNWLIFLIAAASPVPDEVSSRLISDFYGETIARTEELTGTKSID